MLEQNEKLNRFTETVLGEVTRENRDLKRELKEKRDSMVEQARTEAKEKSRAYYDVEASRIRTEMGHEISRHLMDIKRQVYLRRKEIGDEVFDRVRERLVAYTQSPDYAACLNQFLATSLSQLSGAKAVTVRLRAEDMKYAEALVKSAAPVAVTCEEGAIALGGMTVHCSELGLQVDASFDTRLAELADTFVEQFGLSLSDDLDEL